MENKARKFGKYKLLRPIAHGGMAEIYLAELIGEGGFAKKIAIKMIHEHLSSEREFITMFKDEAMICAKLNHPNIVAIYEFGTVGETYYITMEYIDGIPLNELVRITQGVDPAQAFWIIGEVLSALQYAHTLKDDKGNLLGVVHRDVSPQNILLSFNGSVKMIDFGVAKATTQLHETKAGSFKGKYAYMAPEQCKSHNVDNRADIFAAGILLWETLTGQGLYHRPTVFETMEAVVSINPSSIKKYKPDIEKEIDDIIVKAMAKNREYRYKSAEDFQNAIEDFAYKYGYISNARMFSNYLKSLFPEGSNISGNQLKSESSKSVDKKYSQVFRRTLTPGKSVKIDGIIITPTSKSESLKKCSQPTGKSNDGIVITPTSKPGQKAESVVKPAEKSTEKTGHSIIEDSPPAGPDIIEDSKDEAIIKAEDISLNSLKSKISQPSSPPSGNIKPADIKAGDVSVDSLKSKISQPSSPPSGNIKPADVSVDSLKSKTFQPPPLPSRKIKPTDIKAGDVSVDSLKSKTSQPPPPFEKMKQTDEFSNEVIRDWTEDDADPTTIAPPEFMESDLKEETSPLIRKDLKVELLKKELISQQKKNKTQEESLNNQLIKQQPIEDQNFSKENISDMLADTLNTWEEEIEETTTQRKLKSQLEVIIDTPKVELFSKSESIVTPFPSVQKIEAMKSGSFNKQSKSRLTKIISISLVFFLLIASGIIIFLNINKDIKRINSNNNINSIKVNSTNNKIQQNNIEQNTKIDVIKEEKNPEQNKNNIINKLFSDGGVDSENKLDGGLNIRKLLKGKWYKVKRNTKNIVNDVNQMDNNIVQPQKAENSQLINFETNNTENNQNNPDQPIENNQNNQ